MLQSIKKPENELNTTLLTEVVFVAGSQMTLREYSVISVG